MNYIVPALLKKTITFKRMPIKNVLSYEVYATYKDSTKLSGLRTELLDIIQNPVKPNPVIKRITLPYNDNATWKLPQDAYLDVDYQFRLFINENLLISLNYSFNRLTKLITLNTKINEYKLGDKIEMEYYQDIIIKDYALTEDCEITIKPIFKDSYTYGSHNVIV